jgi:polyhydroxyalkanoate synthesis regulator phasin
MLVFDYEENKEYQRCFSYSSPKDTDRKNDLRYYKLPTQTKIMLNSSIDIPSKYLIKANLEEMLKEEENMQINKNIRNNIINLNYARKFKKDILEQYDVIKNNVEDNHKFHKSGVKKAHYMMINDEKQFMFCELELLRIEYDKLEKKVKQLKYKINNHSVIKELENNEKYGIKNESFKEMMMLLKNGINIRPSTKELKKAKE